MLDHLFQQNSIRLWFGAANYKRMFEDDLFPVIPTPERQFRFIDNELWESGSIPCVRRCRGRLRIRGTAHILLRLCSDGVIRTVRVESRMSRVSVASRVSLVWTYPLA